MRPRAPTWRTMLCDVSVKGSVALDAPPHFLERSLRRGEQLARKLRFGTRAGEARPQPGGARHHAGEQDPRQRLEGKDRHARRLLGLWAMGSTGPLSARADDGTVG